MTFIPAIKDQQNLVELAHRTLWSTLHAIRIVNDIQTWKTAVQEAIYQYNLMVHQSTGFSPNLLHHGYEVASPGLLHPEGGPANPPNNVPADKIKYTTQMQQLKELICGVVLKNHEEARWPAAKYYIMRAVNLPLNS